jgi:hypothetical protein
MHEHSFPESSESPEARSQRALAALQYEERAGLGFRRRKHGMGDPYEQPEAYQVDRDPSAGEVFAGMLAGFGTAIGALSLFVRPLLLAFIAAALLTLGVAGGGQATRIARIGFIVAGVCFFLGMLFAIALERPVAW